MSWARKYLYCYSAFMVAGAIFALSHGSVWYANWDLFCLGFCWQLSRADHIGALVRRYLHP